MPHRPWLAVALMILPLATLAPAPVTAQQFGLARRIEGAIRTGRDFADDEWLAGGGVRVPIWGRWELRPSADVLLTDGHPWQGNADVALLGPRGAGYLGLGYARVRRVWDGDSTQASADGVNGFVGITTVLPSTFRPFLEARFTRARGATLFRLVLGINF
jgi:hypothetical protein